MDFYIFCYTCDSESNHHSLPFNDFVCLGFTWIFLLAVMTLSGSLFPFKSILWHFVFIRQALKGVLKHLCAPDVFIQRPLPCLNPYGGLQTYRLQTISKRDANSSV